MAETRLDQEVRNLRTTYKVADIGKRLCEFMARALDDEGDFLLRYYNDNLTDESGGDADFTSVAYPLVPADFGFVTLRKVPEHTRSRKGFVITPRVELAMVIGQPGPFDDGYALGWTGKVGELQTPIGTVADEETLSGLVHIVNSVVTPHGVKPFYGMNRNF